MSQALSAQVQSDVGAEAAAASSLRSRFSQVAGRSGWLAGPAVLLVALAVRLVNLHQPLFENFIDRQVHTAMMARNLAEGGSVLYPEIDVGPFPAYYMLEFPVY